jgi:glyoxylase-like metal-dependent hydrolase (beta-lactamase superfamily II)
MTAEHAGAQQRVDCAPLTTLSLGDVTLTFVPDGVHHIEAPTQYPDSPDSLWDEHPEVIDDEGLLVMSVGSMLIRTPQHTVLVDIGYGPGKMDIAELTDGAFRGDIIGGELIDNLASVGVSPADVDAIVFSHLHVDHVGWLYAPGDESTHVFPNARYVLHRSEWEHWQQEEMIAGGTGVNPAQLAILDERKECVDGPAEVVPRISIVPTLGHTPGHISVMVTGSEASALVLGDAIHCPVEFQHEGMCFVFDFDQERATRSREEIHEILSQPNTWFAGGHFPTQVFGKIGADGKTLNYL